MKKRNFTSILICLSLSLFLLGFQNAAKQQGNSKVVGNNYHFEPEVSTLTGTVKSEVFFGPPGYGENPKTDKKETAYILQLSKPINVIATDPEDDLNSTTKNVTKIQLVSERNFKLSNFNNKTVKVSGTFFSAISGHHHTKILIDVNKIEQKKWVRKKFQTKPLT